MGGAGVGKKRPEVGLERVKENWDLPQIGRESKV